MRYAGNGSKGRGCGPRIAGGGREVIGCRGGTMYRELVLPVVWRAAQNQEGTSDVAQGIGQEKLGRVAHIVAWLLRCGT